MAYTYTLKDIIEITGVTKRTLHYYDEIGLLVPDKNDKNYRVYKQQDLEKLQKILILKSFDFDIAKIKQYISYDNEQLRKLLSEQVSKLDKKISDLQLIRLSVCKFIKGHSLIDTSILNKTLQSQYDKEASIKYGHTKAYQSFIRRKDSLQSHDIRHKLTTIFNKFNHMSLSHYPIQDCSDLVFEWKAFMNTIADFDDETLCCTAKTYEDDTRFKDYFNSYDNQNLASYISEAVNYFLSNVNKSDNF